MRKTVRHFQATLVVLTLLSLAGISLFAILHQNQQKLAALGETRCQAIQGAEQLRRTSDDLTRMARTFVITGDPLFSSQFETVIAIRDGLTPRPHRYQRVYWDFRAIHDAAPSEDSADIPAQPFALLDLLAHTGISDHEFQLLQQAKTHSDLLAVLERQAMSRVTSAIEQGDESARRAAVHTLFDENYHESKIRVMQPINEFILALDQRTRNLVEQQSRKTRLTHLLLGGDLLALAFTVFHLFQRTGGLHHRLLRALERQVRERTAALQDTCQKLQKEIEKREAAQREVKILRGLLPICSQCKSIRDDQGLWNRIEDYLREHSEAEFSHGICPQCFGQLYPEFEYEGP